MKRRRAAVIAVAGATAAVSLIGVPAAQARTIFAQKWNTNAKERASKDFVPHRSQIKIGGHCKPGGSARSFYTQLKWGRGQKKIFSSYSYPCEGKKYIDDRWVKVRKGDSYYLKWFGTDKDSRRYSPGQGVFAAI